MTNFKQTYNRTEFLKFLDQFLPEDFLEEVEPLDFESNYTRKVTRLGECKSLGLEVFEMLHTSTHDARVALSKEAFQLLYNRTTKNKALVLLVPIDSPETYRFSLVSIDVELDEHKVRKSYSNPRRYSYLLGEGAKVYTPTKYLSVKGRVKDSKDLHDRFSVEVLTKEFYNELFTWYQWALSDEIGVTFPNDRSTENDDRKIEEHLIRLITRLMFVWFIKQKKLVPDLLFEVDQLKSLLKNFEATDNKQDTFYRAILQNLFFATLNNKIEERDFAVDGGFYENKVQYGIKTLFRYADEFSVPKEEVIQIFSKVPSLNGGLFECLDKDTPDSKGKIIYSDGFSRRRDKQSRAFLPNILFFDPVKGILSILNKYNFTIEENSPLDVEVALDPELLGKVFENLLGTYNPETKETARKQSGSFYTPREIVQYMVDESLVAHLKRTVGDELEAEYRKLINHNDETIVLTDQQKSDIFKSLKACKILDPACGSGAFPMGILNRMLAIIERLPIPANISIYDLKLYLIENCIYGIDIQSIAVQISKLRFFISLICEQIPNGDSADNYGIKPLPNLETKFVAANTLIGLTPQKAQLNLFEDPQIEVTRNELMQTRHRHFLASTAKQKKECRDEDKKLREKLANLLDRNGDFAPEDARQLADWNPYDQNASSPFFDTEWMFGISSDIFVQKNNIQSSEISALNLQIEAINKQIETINYSLKQNHKPEILKLQFISANLQVSIIETELINIKNNIAELFGSVTNKISNVSREPENITYLINSLNTAIKEVNKKIVKIESKLKPVNPVKNGGYFDIVIGNPPYVQLQKEGGKLAEQLKNQNFETFERTGDIYSLFYERGYSLLRNNGFLTYITSNKWMRAGYGKSLRKFFVSANPLLLVDFGQTMIFENAIVHSNILTIQKSQNARETLTVQFNDEFYKPDISITDYVAEHAIIANKLSDGIWAIAKSSDVFIKDKFEKVGKPLKNWNLEYYRGILTGYNEAFIIDGKTKTELIEKDPQNTDILKPILRGRDTRRYYCNFADYWLINSHNGLKSKNIKRIDVPAEYPGIYEYLIQFQEQAEKRLDKGEHWTNLRNCAYIDEIEKPKIVFSEIVSEPQFYYDTQGYYPEATVFFITGEKLKYLTALLNSKAVTFIFKKFYAGGELVGKYRYKKAFLENLPIPVPDDEMERPFINLVDRILAAKQADPKADTSALESEIDRLVYELYGLTEEEIAIVENK